MRQRIPAIDGKLRLSVFSLLHGRGRYYTSSERVLNLPNTGEEAAKTSDSSIIKLPKHRIKIKFFQRSEQNQYTFKAYKNKE